MTNHDCPPMMCDTCRRALDVVIDNDGVHYRHTPATPDDHEVVPVEPGPGSHGVCDFCAAEHPTHVLPADDFAVPGAPGHVSSGDWLACAACAALLRNDESNGLLARAAARFHALYGYPMPDNAQHHLALVYRALSLAVTGRIRPIDETLPPNPEPGARS